MTHTGVRAATHTRYSHDLEVNVRGVHGHQGYCTCGWAGRQWDTPSKANAEAKWHLWDEHGNELAALRREAESATERAEAS